MSIDLATIEIPLTRPVGNLNRLTQVDWMELIDNQIQSLVPGRWTFDADTGRWTSAAVTFDGNNGDTGAPYPDDDGTYDFNANREHAGFEITGFSGGNGIPFPRPTFTTITQGEYDTVTTLSLIHI